MFDLAKMYHVLYLFNQFWKKYPRTAVTTLCSTDHLLLATEMLKVKSMTGST